MSIVFSLLDLVLLNTKTFKTLALSLNNELKSIKNRLSDYPA
jgi:hypothetical protein